MTTLNVEKKGTTLSIDKARNTTADGSKLILQNNQPATLIAEPVTQVLTRPNKEVQVVEVGIQGPEGAQGPAGDGLSVVLYEITIPPGEQRLIHTFSEDDLCKKWDVAIENDSLQLMAYQIKGAVADPGNTFEWVKYTILGSRIPHSIQYIFNGSLIDYRVTNLSTETLSLKVTSY